MRLLFACLGSGRYTSLPEIEDVGLGYAESIAVESPFTGEGIDVPTSRLSQEREWVAGEPVGRRRLPDPGRGE